MTMQSEFIDALKVRPRSTLPGSCDSLLTVQYALDRIALLHCFVSVVGCFASVAEQSLNSALTTECRTRIETRPHILAKTANNPTKRHFCHGLPRPPDCFFFFSRPSGRNKGLVAFSAPIWLDALVRDLDDQLMHSVTTFRAENRSERY